MKVEIPDDIVQKIRERIKGTSFSSVEEYVVSKLESEFPPKPVYTKDEEARIRERLRRLGYIE